MTQERGRVQTNLWGTSKLSGRLKQLQIKQFLLSVEKASQRQGFQLRLRQGGGEGQDAFGRLAVAGRLDVARPTRVRTVACFWRNRYCRVQRKCWTDERRCQHWSRTGNLFNNNNTYHLPKDRETQLLCK